MLIQFLSMKNLTLGDLAILLVDDSDFEGLYVSVVTEKEGRQKKLMA